MAKQVGVLPVFYDLFFLADCRISDVIVGSESTGNRYVGINYRSINFIDYHRYD